MYKKKIACTIEYKSALYTWTLNAADDKSFKFGVTRRQGRAKWKEKKLHDVVPNKTYFYVQTIKTYCNNRQLTPYVSRFNIKSDEMSDITYEYKNICLRVYYT